MSFLPMYGSTVPLLHDYREFYNTLSLLSNDIEDKDILNQIM